MMQERLKTTGAATSPKFEMLATGIPYTELRLYLVPLRVKANTNFDTFDTDFAVLYFESDTMDYTMAIYERVGAISGTVSAILVANTTIGVAAYSAATLLTTTLAAVRNLVPGDYFIGFIFQSHTTPRQVVITSANAHTNGTWITGDWCYEDQVSYAMPATTGALSYIHAASECPFWAGIRYAGDVLA